MSFLSFPQPNADTLERAEIVVKDRMGNAGKDTERRIRNLAYFCCLFLIFETGSPLAQVSVDLELLSLLSLPSEC